MPLRLAIFMSTFIVLWPLSVRADDAHASAPPAADAAFALDGVERTIAPTGTVRCPKVDLVTYKGDVLKYHTPVRIYVGFRERLRRFETVVRDTAIEVYGRAPRRIHHLGTLNCRRIRTWPEYLSEHGLGNAIDVSGFDFGSLPRRTAPPEGLPNALRRSFQVRLDPDWDGTSAKGAVHARFLQLLAERVVARTDIFRVMLGPAYPGHKNHFHFDCAPWRIVWVFNHP